MSDLDDQSSNRTRDSQDGIKGGCLPPCRTNPCDNQPLRVPIGSVSASPTVTSGGTIVFATDGTDGIPGHLFALEQNGNTYSALDVS